MKKLELPYISERIRGFTIPEAGLMYVSDYDEIYKVTLSGAPSVEWVDGNPYEFEDTPKYLGVTQADPILGVDGLSLSYQFNPGSNSQDVVLAAGERTETISFPTLSGDWFVATFSANGEYLVIAEPYLLEVYQLK